MCLLGRDMRSRRPERSSAALTALVDVCGDVDRRVVVGDWPFEHWVLLKLRLDPAFGGVIGHDLWMEKECEGTGDCGLGGGRESMVKIQNKVESTVYQRAITRK